jgi:hypothetical protein
MFLRVRRMNLMLPARAPLSAPWGHGTAMAAWPGGGVGRARWLHGANSTQPPPRLPRRTATLTVMNSRLKRSE